MSELDWGEWLGSRLGRITSRDTATCVYSIGGSVSTTVRQNELNKRNVTSPCQQFTEGGDFGGFNPPTEIPKALQNRAKLNPIVQNVKNCWI